MKVKQLAVAAAFGMMPSKGLVRARVFRPVVAALLAIGLAVSLADTAGAHSGGTDSSGGHYCREAGYEAGTCSPLGSYHTHDGGGGGGDSTAPEPDPDVYVPAKSANSGDKMLARRMLTKIGKSQERGGNSYDRAKFKHWTDANRDGCDTRQAVLISESRVHASRTANCTVTSGRWVSMYDGRRWSDPADVDIDHVVALKEAWVSGARFWSRSTRRKYANDLAWKHSLRAVTDNVNQSKGDRDPAEWLPARARCTYAINWVQVKYRWRLKANPAERSAVAAIFATDCGSRRIAVPRRAR